MDHRDVSVVLLVAIAACGGAPASSPASAPALAGAPTRAPAPASASAPSTASAAADSPAPAPGPMPTGGSVLVGEVIGSPSFDPRAALDSAKPQLLSCYNQVRRTNASLHGKLKLRINVNEAGTVVHVDAEDGGSANDPALVSCLGDAIKAVRFPKPGGMATIVAPLVFRP